MNIHAHAFLKYTLCNNVSCLRTDLSLGLELMITQHNVLFMEMLFMLIIIIVTDLAWETFLDTCTHDCTAIVYLIQRHCPSYLRMYALGKGLVEFLQP